MRATEKTRKPVDKLTTADLEAFPIWEYAIDEEEVEGQDETWVGPVTAKRIPATAYSQVVAATFRTGSGDELSGHMIVSPAASTAKLFNHSGGSIFAKTGQCFILNLN